MVEYLLGKDKRRDSKYGITKQVKARPKEKTADGHIEDMWTEGRARHLYKGIRDCSGEESRQDGGIRVVSIKALLLWKRGEAGRKAKVYQRVKKSKRAGFDAKWADSSAG